MNILITEPDNYSSEAISLYNNIGKVFLGDVDHIEKNVVNVLVVRLGIILDAAYLSQFESLSLIVTPTTGLTHIDQDYCKTHGVSIVSLQDCKDKIKNISSTAELAFGLLINLIRHIPQAHNDVVKQASWNRDRFCGVQLAGMSIGIVGLGRIGRYMAKYCRAFDMDVYAHDPYIPREDFGDYATYCESLDSMLAKVDILSIHASYTIDNFHLIGAEQLARLSTGAVIINTARGELLDENAAAQALCAGQLGGIAIDVLQAENSAEMVHDSALIAAAKNGKNIVVTPHIGGCTRDAMEMTEICMANYIAEKVL